jgi:PKD repeat protein
MMRLRKFSAVVMIGALVSTALEPSTYAAVTDSDPIITADPPQRRVTAEGRLRRVRPASSVPRSASPQRLSDGLHVHRWRYHAPSAKGMRLHFVRINLPKDARLWIQSLDRPSDRLGPYTGAGPLDSGEFWTQPLAGSQVMVELEWRGGDPAVIPFEIGQIGQLDEMPRPPRPETKRVYGRRGHAKLHGRSVHFQEIDGLAIAEGDIVLGQADEVVASQSDTAGSLTAQSTTIVGSNYRWPNGVMAYEISSSLPNPQRVYDAVAHWNSQLAGHVSIVPRTSQSNYVRFEPSSGCSSYIGYQNRSGQQIYLSDSCGTGNTVHEIGHALGLWHEQCRNDRDSYVRILTQNITSGQENNFAKTGRLGEGLYAYDYGSIMHYGPYAFTSNGQPTIETIPAGIPIGQRLALSSGDIAGTKYMYPGGAPTNRSPTASFSANPSPPAGTAPFAVSFDASASSDPDGTISSYAWNFGNGQTGSGRTVSHTFTSAGSFRVMLTVRDNLGAVAASHLYVTVTAPNAAPTAQNQSVSTPEDTSRAVTLTATDPEGSTLSYSIVTQPARGTLSGSGAARTYTPAANFAGTDSFTFKATDGQRDSGIATVSITVTPVNDSPVAQMSITPSAGAAPLTVAFDARASSDVEGAPASYTWRFGDGASGSGATVSHVYTTGGSFSVSLTVTDAQGAVDTTSGLVTVNSTANQPPTASAQSFSTPEDTPRAVTLAGSDPEGRALTYAVLAQPRLGTLSGTGSQRTYTPHPDANGADSFTFRVNDGAQDSAPATVSITVTPVNDPPEAEAAVTPQLGYAPMVVNFDGTGSSDPEGPIASYSWTFGDGGVSGAANGEHVYTAPGSFIVRFVATDGAGAQRSVQRIVSVLSPEDAIPAPDLSAINGGTFPVDGEITVPYGAAATSFNWEFSPGVGGVVELDSPAAPGRFSLAGPLVGSDTAAAATAVPRFRLSTLHLAPGIYTVRVQAVNGSQVSRWSSAAISLTTVAAVRIKVHPNPWRARWGPDVMRFSGLPANAQLRIFTVSGHLVRDLGANTDTATWDLRTDSGDRVASGVYLFLCTYAGGDPVRGKLAIVR